MDSTVRPRPNHYEALGLDPAADAGEIGQAYARILRRPSTVGQIALAGIAYEVLRDPAKRAAYDEAIGLTKPPQPALLQWSAQSPFAAPYLTTARAEPAVAQPVPAISSRPQIEPRSREDQGTDERLPSFLATALRDIAKAEPLAGATIEPAARSAERAG